jgi:phenylalanine-4-hydroxylase
MEREYLNPIISAIVQEDIALYFSLQPQKTSDLFEHCAVLTDQLYQEYQRMI